MCLTMASALQAVHHPALMRRRIGAEHVESKLTLQLPLALRPHRGVSLLVGVEAVGCLYSFSSSGRQGSPEHSAGRHRLLRSQQHPASAAKGEMASRLACLPGLCRRAVEQQWVGEDLVAWKRRQAPRRQQQPHQVAATAQCCRGGWVAASPRPT